MLGLSDLQFNNVCWFLLFFFPLVLLFLRVAWDRWIEPKIKLERLLEQARTSNSVPPSFYARVGHKTIVAVRCAMIGASLLVVFFWLLSADWVWNHPVREYVYTHLRYRDLVGPYSGEHKITEYTKKDIAEDAKSRQNVISAKVADDGYGNFLVTTQYVERPMYLSWYNRWYHQLFDTRTRGEIHLWRE